MGVSEAAEQSASPLHSLPFRRPENQVTDTLRTCRTHTVYFVSRPCYTGRMDDTILDDWFTKTQAAAFLKVSEKTVERLATKGTVRRATRKRPGVRPSPVYCPDDLERVKAAQTAQMIVMPPQEADPGELAVPASRAGELSVFLQSLITAATVPLRDKLFLNIKEAARFAGLPPHPCSACSRARSH